MNLILLCPNHHAEIEAQPETLTVEPRAAIKDGARAMGPGFIAGL
jgi:hypothetical protein